MAGQIVIHAEHSGGYRFNLLDQDGTVLSSSKRFEGRDDAVAGAERAKRLMEGAEIVDQVVGG